MGDGGERTGEVGGRKERRKEGKKRRVKDQKEGEERKRRGRRGSSLLLLLSHSSLSLVRRSFLQRRGEVRGDEKGRSRRNSERIVLTPHIYFLDPCFTLLFCI